MLVDYYVHRRAPIYKEKFLINTFTTVIVVDGINEPFDDKFSFAYEHLSKLCNDNGIQLIVMSTERTGNHIFDISSGLNSNHNK